MKKSKFSEEQIAFWLREVEGGRPVSIDQIRTVSREFLALFPLSIPEKPSQHCACECEDGPERGKPGRRHATKYTPPRGRATRSRTASSRGRTSERPSPRDSPLAGLEIEVATGENSSSPRFVSVTDPLNTAVARQLLTCTRLKSWPQSGPLSVFRPVGVESAPVCHITMAAFRRCSTACRGPSGRCGRRRGRRVLSCWLVSSDFQSS